MSEPFIGEIKMVGFNFAPRGYALCEGQLLPISSYSAVFSLLGTTFGGDGRTTFGLPDMRGRSPVGVGAGAGLGSYTWGEKGGVEDVTLNVTQIPSHNHTAAGTQQVSNAGGSSTDPEGNYPAKLVRERAYGTSTNASMAANSVQVTVNNNGGSQSHTNLSPFLAVYFVIALQGIFPSRS
ncbi:MAG: tail fiber protein [Ardenticatenaceae bacterium]|nr:tail fiber protein [Ardenticatenaceae bacterium]